MNGSTVYSVYSKQEWSKPTEFNHSKQHPALQLIQTKLNASKRIKAVLNIPSIGLIILQGIQH